jgi:hypothetical protein
VCEAIIDLFGFAFWLAGAIVLTMENNKADAVPLPQGAARDGVLAMAWLSMALFLLMFLINVGTAIRIKKTLRSERKANGKGSAFAHSNDKVPPPAGGAIATEV